MVVWDSQNKQSQCHWNNSPYFLGDDSAPSFEPHPKKNHGVTAPSAHILLRYYLLKCQRKNRTHRPGQKLPPPGKKYLCSKMGGETSHAAQCYKSSATTKAIDLILAIK